MLVTSALVQACAGPIRQSPDPDETGGAGGASSGSGGAGQGGDIGLGGMGGTSADGLIYVNTLEKLYKYEPTSSKLTEIGAFDCVLSDPSGSSDAGMHDIAVDKDGAMFGVAKVGPQSPDQPQKQDHGIVSIDTQTGDCQKVLTMPVGILRIGPARCTDSASKGRLMRSTRRRAQQRRSP